MTADNADPQHSRTQTSQSRRRSDLEERPVSNEMKDPIRSCMKTITEMINMKIFAITVAFAVMPAMACLADDTPPRPNVLLIVSDDLTCCLGSYGNTVCQTPSLNRLADQSVQFNRAYCQFPVCGLSRASMMSGLYPEQLEFMGNNYTVGSYRALNPKYADHPSIGGLLRRNG